ncbi:MAG: hypothetical protein L0Z62_07270 [Gemmataceae bacterium]|nr:hypothetical protein [Gemmataceae bacterium]
MSSPKPAPLDRSAERRAEPTNHPAYERCMVGLWVALDAAQEFLADTEGVPECEGDRGLSWCGPCRVNPIGDSLEAAVPVMGWMVSELANGAYPFPQALDRLQE